MSIQARPADQNGFWRLSPLRLIKGEAILDGIRYSVLGARVLLVIDLIRTSSTEYRVS